MVDSGVAGAGAGGPEEDEMRATLVRAAAGLALGAALALPASASDKTWSFGVGGGASLPSSDLGDRFDTGWNLQADFTYHATPSLGLQLGYGHHEFGAKSDFFDLTALEATQKMDHLGLALVLGTPRDRGLGGYLVAGGGLYFREVEVTRFEGSVTVPVCDPWLGFCYGSTVPVESIVGQRSNTDLGVNVGAGLTLKAGDDVTLFVEARFHQVWGDEYQTPTGSRKANAQFFPITVGLRF